MKREPPMAEGRASDAGRRRSAADRVSEAADRLFYERGIRAVGVEEIVAQAGVTKPSLYRSYASKDDLVVACLESRFAQIMADLDVLDLRYPDPLDWIRAKVARSAQDFEDDAYRGCPISNAAVEFPDPDHPLRPIAMAYKARIRERFLAVVSRLPTNRTVELADALVLLFEGAQAMRHTSDRVVPPRALTAAVDAVLAGFLATPGSPSE